MSVFIKERLKGLKPYTPGEQPKDKNYIKLNTNESPFPPGPKVLEALSKEEIMNLRLYPSPDQSRLKEKIRDVYKNYAPSLTKENVFVSNGSDDIINFAFMAYSGDGRPAIFPDISYGFYSVFSEFQGVEKIEIPLKENFSINPGDYYNKPDGLIIIANPNAPTGKALERKEVESIVSNNPGSVVLVDEAYIDFGGETSLPLIERYNNLIVSRTFSKSSSLAGARLGFAFGHMDLMEDLEIIKYSTNPYSVNRMTEKVGISALDEMEYYLENAEEIKRVRDWTGRKLYNLGLNPIESKANFIMVGTGDESKDEVWKRITGEHLYILLKERGILVRWFNKERIKNYLRITIGKKEDMEALIETLEGIKKG